MTRTQTSGGGPSANGSWVPEEIIEPLGRLVLKPASRWNVFLVIFLTWCRYGYGEAFLTIGQIADRTKLSPRTVKSAVKGLLELGVIKRIGRAGKFAVDVHQIAANGRVPREPNQPQDGDEHAQGADRRAQHAICGSPKPRCSSSAARKGFTARQQAVIRSTLDEMTELLGSDAADLLLPAQTARTLGLEVGVTLGKAFALLNEGCDARVAHKFTGALFSLRADERIQGTELVADEREIQEPN